MVKQRPLKILLIDDAEDNRFLVKAYLKKENFYFETAENGQQGLDKFMLETFDLVLLDMQMPILDGRQTARKMRKWESDNKTPPTPIIALTAETVEEEIQSSLAAGCNIHISKPIKKNYLLENIKNLTGQFHKK